MATPRGKSTSKILPLFSFGWEIALAGASTLSILCFVLFLWFDELGNEIGQEREEDADEGAGADIREIVVHARHSAKHREEEPYGRNNEE